MRWRGAVHKMARLRNSLSAAQLTTFRYEQVVREPQATAGALAAFIDATHPKIAVPHGQKNLESRRRLLSPAQPAEIQNLSGHHLPTSPYRGHPHARHDPANLP